MKICDKYKKKSKEIKDDEERIPYLFTIHLKIY